MTLMRILILLGSLLFGTMTPAFADPLVVELFASQNCRSCPKAHETLAKVSDARDDVLILTWSVDYWDYLGDRDPMAMPESRIRQAAYAERFRLRGPYTPQSVYNGERQCPGNKPRDVNYNIKRLEPLQAVSMEYDAAGRLVIASDMSSASDVWLIHFIPELVTESAVITNAVTSVEKLGIVEGAMTQAYSVRCDTGCAILVQDKDYGPIRGAMQLR